MDKNFWLRSDPCPVASGVKSATEQVISPSSQACKGNLASLSSLGQPRSTKSWFLEPNETEKVGPGCFQLRKPISPALSHCEIQMRRSLVKIEADWARSVKGFDGSTNADPGFNADSELLYPATPCCWFLTLRITTTVLCCGLQTFSLAYP